MKLFIPLIFIAVAVLLGISFIFTQGMYASIGTESNQTMNNSPMTPENESYEQYEVQFAWQVAIAIFAVIAAIGMVLWLVWTNI